MNHRKKSSDNFSPKPAVLPDDPPVDYPPPSYLKSETSGLNFKSARKLNTGNVYSISSVVDKNQGMFRTKLESGIT